GRDVFARYGFKTIGCRHDIAGQVDRVDIVRSCGECRHHTTRADTYRENENRTDPSTGWKHAHLLQPIACGQHTAAIITFSGAWATLGLMRTARNIHSADCRAQRNRSGGFDFANLPISVKLPNLAATAVTGSTRTGREHEKANSLFASV